MVSDDCGPFVIATPTASGVGGQDLRAETGQDRREALGTFSPLAIPSAAFRLSEHVDVVDGATCSSTPMGSNASSPSVATEAYRSGRSKDWIKIKNPSAPAATRVIEG